jgi:hypothetical protein
VFEPLLNRARELWPALYDEPDALLPSIDPASKGSRDVRRLPVDIAATAQWIFEQNGLQASRDLATGLRAAG